MSAGVYVKAGAETPHRQGLLGSHYDCFVTWMMDRGYSVFTMRRLLWHVTYFGRYLKRRHVESIDQLEGPAGRKLLASYARRLKRKGYSRRYPGVRVFVRALRETGALAPAGPQGALLLPVMQEYTVFLRDQKGICEGNIRGRHMYYLGSFLRFLGWREEDASVPPFGIADIDRFIEHVGVRLKRTTVSIVTGVLRGFVRFLYQTGKRDTDLSPLITSPRQYKLQSLPAVLQWSDVRKVLGAVDRSARNGARDYAILVLLATYGLRAGEAARLKLEDIDWRRRTLHIAPGKTGKDRWLPLTPQAGKAVLQYLKHGRPRSEHREVFLIARAPRTPINYGSISHLVSRCIRHAGLDPPRRGAHVLRHSFAAHLFRGGASLKGIGDLMGHQCPESTHIYTKSVADRLREAALEVPEGQQCKGRQKTT
jgi:site-specific recombinase XerD